jgi:hypothetical protein
VITRARPTHLPRTNARTKAGCQFNLTASSLPKSCSSARWLTANRLLIHLSSDWLPCRGSMLSYSIVYGYAYIGPDFSDACLRRMDGEQAPWAFERDIAARRSPASRGSPSF